MIAKKRIAGLTLVSALLFSTVAAAMLFGTVQAATEVAGIITSDTTWTRANSPYDLTGNVLVEIGVTLTIEADTTVNFNDYYLRVNGSLTVQPGVILNIETVIGDGSIQVNGVMTLRGTSTNPIYVNGVAHYYDTTAPIPPSRSSIVFSHSSAGWNEQTGSGCFIENAIFNSTGVRVGSSVKITNNKLIDGGLSVSAGSSVISQNSLSSLGIGGGSPAISANTISGPITISGGSPAIYSNVITGYISITGGSSNIADNRIVGGFIKFYAEGKKGVTATIINNNISSTESSIGNDSGIRLTGNWGTDGYVLVERNSITGCSKAVEIIQYQYAGITTAFTIQKNTITNNDVGISIKAPYYCAPTISYNNIYSNNVSLSLSGTSFDIDATNNWWGTTDTSAIDDLIYDFYDGDFDLGKVNYTPFLTEADPLAMPDPNAPIPSFDTSTLPSQTSTPDATPPPSTTPDQNAQQAEQLIVVAGLAITIIVICTGLGLLIYIIKKK